MQRTKHVHRRGARQVDQGDAPTAACMSAYGCRTRRSASYKSPGLATIPALVRVRRGTCACEEVTGDECEVGANDDDLETPPRIAAFGSNSVRTYEYHRRRLSHEHVDDVGINLRS